MAADKAPLLAMAARLYELWSRHLSFCEGDFWTIVYEELSGSGAAPWEMKATCSPPAPPQQRQRKRLPRLPAPGPQPISIRRQVNL